MTVLSSLTSVFTRIHQIPVICGLALALFPASALAEIALSADGHLEWRQAGQILASTASAGMTRVVLEDGSQYTEQLVTDAAEWQLEGSTLIRATPWGRLALEIEWKGQEARIDFTLEAAPDVVIADFTFTLLSVFPGVGEGPEGGIEGAERLDFSNLDRPFIHSWASGGERLTVGFLGEGPPVRVRQQAHSDGSGAWTLSIAGGVHRMKDGGLTLPFLGSARADETQAVSGQLLVKVSNAGMDTRLINARYWQAFREATSVPIDWPDRRPIGSIFVLGNSGAKNPFGLFWNSGLDASDPEAVLAAAEAFAQRAVGALTAVGAQAFIVWDIEGPTAGFVGDPRMLPILNPQMDGASDRLFEVLREAGFTPGITIRPTQVYFNTSSNNWVHGTGSHGPERNPLNENFDDIWPDDVPWWQFYPTVERMSRKIQYAKDRWGCQIFYIDTNGIWRQVGASMDFRFILLNAGLMRELRLRHPDVLLIPELERTDGSHLQYGLWGSTAPYGQLNLAGWGTPDWLRDVYPDAFSIINIADGDMNANRAALIEHVSKGDILLFRGWFTDGRNVDVKAIYEAGSSLRSLYP